MFKRIFTRFKNFVLRIFGIHQEPPAPVPSPPAQETSSPIPTPTPPPVFSGQPAPLVAPELVLPSTEPPLYQQRDSLFTYREKIFFIALLDALKWDYWAFAKVRMADVIFLANESADRKLHNNQIQCKHLDFVICEKKTYRPVLVIELDDNTHFHPDRQARDEFKNTTLAQAGLPLLRVPLQKYYNPETLRKEIFSALQKNVSMTT